LGFGVLCATDFCFPAGNPVDIAAIINFVATPAVITHFVPGERKSDAALREQADLLNLSSVEG